MLILVTKNSIFNRTKFLDTFESDLRPWVKLLRLTQLISVLCLNVLLQCFWVLNVDVEKKAFCQMTMKFCQISSGSYIQTKTELWVRRLKEVVGLGPRWWPHFSSTSRFTRLESVVSGLLCWHVIGFRGLQCQFTYLASQSKP